MKWGGAASRNSGGCLDHGEPAVGISGWSMTATVKTSRDCSWPDHERGRVHRSLAEERVETGKAMLGIWSGEQVASVSCLVLDLERLRLRSTWMPENLGSDRECCRRICKPKRTHARTKKLLISACLDSRYRRPHGSRVALVPHLGLELYLSRGLPTFCFIHILRHSMRFLVSSNRICILVSQLLAEVTILSPNSQSSGSEQNIHTLHI
ncbi:uncharacterized protein BJ212DRAFT_963401 [Suillus subaureus]|uniref:Uncharacterized protein n=1 Tax=Suillus subaureus TaxID=48587 RepID=A0A9P7EG00_9AGAM|nr:uncharacterized protein BJ212DRAFT_963401 [Suillus subaureus]KAG1820836.1 hypothetical protein BJ212DRAFT_963401 [Suillus subaureus]